MTTESRAVEELTPARPRKPDDAIPSRRDRSVPRAGWMVVAGKEFADHLWSARFVILLLLLGVVALIPMYLDRKSVV